MNALLPSTQPPAAGARDTTPRADAASAGEPGEFAQVLGERLQQAAHGREPEAAPAARAARHGAARGSQDDAARDTPPADALPLIAAALEMRPSALPKGDAAATADRATSIAQGSAVARADGAHSRIALGPDATGAAPQSEAATGAQGDAIARAPGEQLARASLAAGASAPEHDAPGTAELAPRTLAPGQDPAPPATATLARQRAGGVSAAGDADRGTGKSAPAATGGDAASRPVTPEHAAPNDTDSHPALSGPGVLAMAGPSSPSPVAPAPAASAAPSAMSGHVAPPVDSPAWGAALGQQLARMHHGGQGQAQLELNPPGLGPLSVSLSVADQQAQAMFVSPHAAVRAALEAALPQLRSALADSGITLGQASVGAEHQPGSGAFSQAQHGHATQRRPAAAPLASPDRVATAAHPPRRGGHVLDTFA